MSIRTAVFIDANYLRHVLQSEFRGARIDLELFARALCAEAQLLRSYYYDCPSFQSNPPTDDERLRYAAQRRFFEALNALPRFSVRLGRLERRCPDDQGAFTFEQKRVDILLGVDLVSLATKQAIQEAILVAGDSDFIPAIHASKNEGVMIKLVHGSTYHADLWKEADERIPITKELVDAVRREDP